jgi:uncharacterized membrane protein
MDNAAYRALTIVVGYAIPLVEACGMIIIALEVIRTVIRYIRTFFKDCPFTRTGLRMQLGQSMVVGLEFLVAADILKTALSPSWNDILFLAALIGLRTVLNYLLEHELRMLNREARADPDAEA